jgi:hypothetical protein
MTDKNPIEDLREIRKMMESSSKFLSLSGLSGVFAGLCALIGAWFAYREMNHMYDLQYWYAVQGRMDDWNVNLNLKLAIIAIIVLVSALSFGILFTWLKARKQKKKLWTPLSIRLIISLMVPLGFGGLFIIGLYYQGYFALIAPATLIFYGLALLNGSKYVHVDIKYLALCEMALGVLAVFKLYYGLYFWAIGFGVLHILYGLIMYFKYDRK